MKNLKINTLFLLSSLIISCGIASAASIEVNFTDGADMAAPITGGVKFNGSGSCTFSGSVTDDARIEAGNVKVSSAAPFGTDRVIFQDDGTGRPRSLEATVTMDLPELEMNAAGTVTVDADVNLKQISGSSALTLAGPAQVTPIVDSSASTSDLNFTNVGGLKIESLAHKLPTGQIAIAAASRVEVAAGLEISDGDVAASSQWNFLSNSTIKLNNGAQWNTSLTIA